MSATGIFDIGKTNKKFIVFDENYDVLYEDRVVIPEIKDDDGDPCEDLSAVKDWIIEKLQTVFSGSSFQISKLNFSTYGASLVHIDNKGNTVTPFYNYLKQFPKTTRHSFFNKYGNEDEFSRITGSPFLGMLNSRC